MKKHVEFDYDEMQALVEGNKSAFCLPISVKYIINDDPARYKCHGIIETNNHLGGKPSKSGVAFEDLRPVITPWLTPIPLPYQVGQTIIVKEKWKAVNMKNHDNFEVGFRYFVDDKYIQNDLARTCFVNSPDEDWRSASHMPYFAARFKLTITKCYAIRVQDITQEQARLFINNPAHHRPSSTDCPKHADNSLKRDCYYCAFSFWFKCAFRRMWQENAGTKSLRLDVLVFRQIYQN